MYYGQQEGMFNDFRVPDDREGGRMHGHTDQQGTDGVVLLNLGSCDFFFDIGKGAGVGKCVAQQTKECWCVGTNHGHWTTKADSKERYTSHEVEGKPYLLRDRLCAACAAGGQGQECPGCKSGTTRLRSGDLVVFSGQRAFHGVSCVVPERPIPQPAQGPPLPMWAQEKLDGGWRLSVQWRLTNRDIEQGKVQKETRDWDESALGGVKADLLASDAGQQRHLQETIQLGQEQATEEQQLQRAIWLSQQDASGGSHNAPGGRREAPVSQQDADGGSREAAILLDSDEEADSAQQEMECQPMTTAANVKRSADTQLAQMRLARLARFS